MLAAWPDRRRPVGVPRIHFGVGTGELLGAMREAGADVVGVDFRVPLDEAARRVGPDVALQGNLDPAALFAPPAGASRRRSAQVLAAAAGCPATCSTSATACCRRPTPTC